MPSGDCRMPPRTRLGVQAIANCGMRIADCGLPGDECEDEAEEGSGGNAQRPTFDTQRSTRKEGAQWSGDGGLFASDEGVRLLARYTVFLSLCRVSE